MISPTAARRQTRFTVQQILQKWCEYQIPTFHLFIDIKAAYQPHRAEDHFQVRTSRKILTVSELKTPLKKLGDSNYVGWEIGNAEARALMGLSEEDGQLCHVKGKLLGEWKGRVEIQS